MVEARKQPMPKIIASPKSPPGKLAMMTDAIPSQDRIRERAYELYEGRGCAPGREEQDWLCAEHEILKQRQ